MKVTFTIDGLRELDMALAQLPKATAKAALRRVARKALQPMAETARELAPDDPRTGGMDLRASITVGTNLNARQRKLRKRRDDKAFVEVYMGTADPAGATQEFGTVNHGPQAFMRPAYAREAENTIRIVATELGGEIDKTARRYAARQAKKAGL